MTVASGILDNLVHRLRAQLLGECPACGREVPANAGALRYHGDFYHVGCVLRQRVQAH
jgi:hypothetical protein